MKGAPFRFSLTEMNGALGDLGTLLPLMLGTILVVGLAPAPVLCGFGLFYIATAFVYRLPIPVQPMKAVVAVLLTEHIGPGALAASGVMIGAVLLLLGVTGWITNLARLVPQSVLAGLQLGLGLALAWASLALLGSAPIVGAVAVAILAAFVLVPRVPGALVALAAAAALAQFSSTSAGGVVGTAEAVVSIPALPSFAEIERAVTLFVLPQLSLTLTNAVAITALLAGDYFGERAAHVTPARLSVTSGLANLALTPLGALPMCHGAGGLAAHHRFGARSGTAPLVLGIVLIVLALLPQGWGLAALTAVPAAGLGALLLFASGELAFSRRLFDSKVSCWPVIAMTAGVTVWLDPFMGLVAGIGTEFVRSTVVRIRRSVP